MAADYFSTSSDEASYFPENPEWTKQRRPLVLLGLNCSTAAPDKANFCVANGWLSRFPGKGICFLWHSPSWRKLHSSFRPFKVPV